MPTPKNRKSGRDSKSLIPLAIALASQPALAFADSNFQPFAHLNDSPVTALREASDAVEAQLADKSSRRERLLSFVQKVLGNGLTTHKFQAYLRGVEIIGATSFHHKDSAGSFVSSSVTEFDISTQPTLSPQEAASIVLGSEKGLPLSGAPELKVLPSDQGDSARLVYIASVRSNGDEPGSDSYIDAHSGEVIARISHHQEIAPRPSIRVHEASSICQLLDPNGMPMALNASRCPLKIKDNAVTPGASTSALQAATNSKKVRDYFYNIHGRSSYDNKGSPLVSVVKVGRKFSNAFWDSESNIMAYGEGDGVEFGDFTRGLDVAGHEMTHGVTSQTAKLVYMGESGALNEANSDFFGMIIANQADWQLGKNLFLDPTKARAIRDLAHPNSLTVRYRDARGQPINKPYPAHLSQKFPESTTCDQSNDNCWVHVNSTIPGHASYLVTQAIGRDKAQKLYYTVLTQFLSARSNFKQARDSTMTACSRMLSAADCNKVKAAYAQVGL